MCYCKLRLVTREAPPPWWGLRRQIFFILITLALDHWKRHFQEENYIENYFCLLKRTKSTKTTSQKCWNIIWADTTQMVSKHVWVCRWLVGACKKHSVCPVYACYHQLNFDTMLEVSEASLFGYWSQHNLTVVVSLCE